MDQKRSKEANKNQKGSNRGQIGPKMGLMESKGV